MILKVNFDRYFKLSHFLGKFSRRQIDYMFSQKIDFDIACTVSIQKCQRLISGKSKNIFQNVVCCFFFFFFCFFLPSMLSVNDFMTKISCHFLFISTIILEMYSLIDCWPCRLLLLS